MLMSSHNSANYSSLAAVVFDLDGVLIDSEPLMRYAFSEAYNRIVGVGRAPIEEYLKHLGDSFPNIMRSMGLPIEMWEPFRNVSSMRLDLASVFPNIKEILDHLAKSGVRMGILTGKDLERTEKTLSHFELRDFFQVLVTPEVVPNPKPHPDGLEYALIKLGCSKNVSIFVGDAINDMLCAKHAGVTSVAALWGIKVGFEQQVTALANYVASSPQDFLKLLLSDFNLPLGD